MANILQRIKSKIIDKTSDVMTIPARARVRRIANQVKSDINALKEDRGSGGNFIEPDPTSKAFQVRTLANDVRFRRGSKSNY